MDPNDEIVISGISGKYPECNNIEELKEALLNGVDVITDDDRRYPSRVLGLPPRSGKLPQLDKFDSTYFGVHAKQAEFMDPRHRILCESVYEAMVDAGYNPKELRGTNTGVYVGLTMFSNPDAFRDREDSNGYINIGYSGAMASNRISYCFDLKGKSYTLDTACSSAMYGMINAIQDIKNGLADAAIVCGSHLITHPQETSEFNKLNMLAADGKCKVFNTIRDGYVRAETIVAILLQKKNVARRVYATVMGAASNADGHKGEGITFPSTENQMLLMDEIYHHKGVDAEEVAYVEAHGTGTPAGDEKELQAIVNMFCKHRTTPLLVGAVKSNLGHAETASAMASISKVLLAMETGVIPANLHVDHVDTSLPGIEEGQIKIVTENVPWNGGIVAVNSFGFGGANAHVALKSNPKEKSGNYKSPKHRLVQVSGRTEEAVNHFLDEIERNRDDEEFLALVDEIHKMNCENHGFRGYTVLGEKPKREVSKYTNARPIWFIYTGMGAQWLSMGRDMMNNETFRNTIQRCAAALKPYNIDLVDTLTSTSPNTFDDSTNCFTAIAAVEIAMTDILYSLDIIPDGIAGHSLGEVACSYADGNITPEQAVLLAYARGYASKCVRLPAGAMAAVGLPKDDCLKLLPDDICIACQNGKGSVTISGPEKSTMAFVDKLVSQGIFAKTVNTGGLAYHSKYIKDGAPYLYDFIKKILKEPEPRTSKWVSTSVNEKQKNEHWAQYNCAEYHKNNFCSPVLFDEIYKHIPENAIVVEVAPHGLMQAILKRELHPNSTTLSLANRNSPDNEECFLSSIGKIYLAGGQPNLKKLYTSVSYPVSRGTKMLSPLVRWDHSISWLTPNWIRKDFFGHVVRVNISDEQYSYLAGHNVDGRVLMPATGYLELAWRTLAYLHLKYMKDLPVVIENVRLKRATVLPPSTDVEFLVNITKQSGYFEIFEGGSVVSTGTIYTASDVSKAYCNARCPEIALGDDLPLTSDDLYKECHLRRYRYEGQFRGIKECDINGFQGRIKWTGNFVTFLDAMLHLPIISETKRDLALPTEIKKVVIDPREHLRQIDGQEDIPLFYNKYVNVARSGGIEVKGLHVSNAPIRRQAQEDLLLETYEFSPYVASNESYSDTWLSTAIQIILQNIEGYPKYLKICHSSGNVSNQLIVDVKKILDRQPMVDVKYIAYNSKEDDNTKFDAIVSTDDSKVDLDTQMQRLTDGGMILYKGDISKISTQNVNIVYKATAANNSGIYLIKPTGEFPSNYRVVYIRNSDFDWLEKIRNLVHSHSKEVVYLVNEDEDFSGIVGLLKCLLTEPTGLHFRCVLIQDKKAAVFSPDHEFYRDQLAKNITFNVLRNGLWGTFVHLPLRPIENKEVQDAAVSILTVGDLSTLCWKESSGNYLKCNEASEQVYVYYSSLNFKDVMVSTGNIVLPQADEPTIPTLNIGIEFSGITRSGKRVMGTVQSEAMALQVQSFPGLTWEVPKDWTLDEAATVPVVYSTCYFALLIKGQMEAGESILIHAGTGGIGLAAISIALSMGCEVFTTVGSQEKRDYLKTIYPQIKDENIGDSRSTSFMHTVMENTKGKGVDLVLNSLSGELFKESLACTASKGRFLEIGKVDFLNNTLIETRKYLNNNSFHGIALEHFNTMNAKHLNKIKYLVSEGLKSGVVKPLPRTIFKEHEVEDAFRFLASGKHKGKVMIELRSEGHPVPMPPKRTISAVPKVYFHPNKSYILVGGLGGIGLELADWLIRRGATKIVLNSRSHIYNGYQSYCFKRWSKWKGITVETNIDDTTTLEGARNLVSFANLLGPVGGVFNMALVLMDGLIENQTPQMYEAVFKPKIASGVNMDRVTRSRCPELDHFVVFSSAACGRGNSGQSNYGMANSALEQLCEKRRRENLPALAVQWGPIGEVGALIRNKIINKLADQMMAQNISSCIETLEKFMLQNSVIGSSMVVASKTATTSRDTTKTLAEAVAHILGIRHLDAIDQSLTLIQLGLDSLMTAEIKQTVYRNYSLEIDANEIKDLTFKKLIDMSEVDENNNVMPGEDGIRKEVYDIFTAVLSKEPVILLNRYETVSRPIFMIHSIEGHLEILKSIAQQLKATVYGVQYTKEADFDNFQDHASYCIRQIKLKQPEGPYFLCGYSFGAVLALEMGFQLEKGGEDVQVVFLDGSPAYVKEILDDHFEKLEKSVDKSKITILVNFASIFAALEKKEVEEELAAIEGWENQLRRVGELMSKETGLDVDHLVTAVDRYYKRCLACFEYQPEGTLNGRVLLIRVDNDRLISSEDYGLQRLCKQDVEIVKLKGDHKTVVLGENSRIISDKINARL